MDSQTFIKRVMEELKEIAREYDYHRSGDVFCIWFVKNILLQGTEIGEIIDNYYIGGSADEKLDIGVADDDHELVILGQCKFPDGDTLIEEHAETFELTEYNEDPIDQVKLALQRLENPTDRGNTKWKEFLNKFKEQLEPNKSNLKLIAVIFGNLSQNAQKYAIANKVDVYSFERIKREYIRKHSPEGKLVNPQLLDFKYKGGYTEYVGSNFKAFSILLNTNDIGEAVDKFGNGLFTENLRYKLEGINESRIAHEIENTVSNNPEKLSILNNGLTIVCNTATIVEDDTRDGCLRTGKISLIEPKVVNGCQTSWAIFEAYKKKAGLNEKLDAYVFARIIETGVSDYTNEVTDATNNQNPINGRDKRSKDQKQEYIANAFAEYDPKILYDYKSGLRSAIGTRLKQFMIRNSRGRETERSIDNSLVGQLYLALLGEPVFAKTDKKQIFENTDIYKAIFYYDLSAQERFNVNTEKLVISPNSTKLRSGKIEYFIEDVFFAFALYQLIHAYQALYRKKLQLYDEEEDADNGTQKRLVEDYSFIKMWDLTIVASINHIVNVLSNSNENQMKQLRNKIINLQSGNDKYWRQGLEKKFNLNENKMSEVLLNEDNPSDEFPTFSKWIISISQLLYELVSAQRSVEKENFSMRRFIQLSPETYKKLTNKIDEKLAKPRQVRDDWFPLPA